MERRVVIDTLIGRRKGKIFLRRLLNDSSQGEQPIIFARPCIRTSLKGVQKFIRVNEQRRRAVPICPMPSSAGDLDVVKRYSIRVNNFL